MNVQPFRLYVFTFAVSVSLAVPFSPSLAAGATVSYAGQQVVQVTARTAEEAELIHKLNLDIWSCFEPEIGTFDVRVTPEQLTQLGDLGIPFRVLIADLQSLVDSERESIARAAQAANGDWFQSYKQYSEINDHLDFLAQSYPDLTQTATIGQSIEGRDIRMIRVTGPDAEGNPRDGRPAFVINGTQHAREWISPMTVMFAAEHLLGQYDADPRTRAVLDAVDFYFVPAINPDGYDFTWTNDRFWRKNRRVNDRPNCPGVDLNRNWNVGWGGNGAARYLHRFSQLRGSRSFPVDVHPQSATRCRSIEQLRTIDVGCDFWRARGPVPERAGLPYSLHRGGYRPRLGLR
jgi:hypothetical protein